MLIVGLGAHVVVDVQISPNETTAEYHSKSAERTISYLCRDIQSEPFEQIKQQTSSLNVLYPLCFTVDWPKVTTTALHICQPPLLQVFACFYSYAIGCMNQMWIAKYTVFVVLEKRAIVYPNRVGQLEFHFRSLEKKSGSWSRMLINIKDR